MNLEIIRDAFLEGKDAKAVVLLLESLIDSIEIEPEVKVDVNSPPENYIGINSDSLVVRNGICSITVRPQKGAFRPNRFMAASSIAPFFMIDQIRIGNMIQGMSHHSISAELFSSSRRRFPRIIFETAQLAMDITVTVRNIGILDTPFMGGFFGLTA